MKTTTDPRPTLRPFYSLRIALWRWPLVLILIWLASAISRSVQAQEGLLDNLVPTSSLLLPEARKQTDNAIQKRTSDVLLALLLANSAKQNQQPTEAPQNQKPPAPAGSGKPQAKTMLAISCYEETATQNSEAFLLQCRTEGPLSNATPTGRILIKGVVTLDIVSGGKILIAAGSKVSGIGHVDPDSGRVESKGDWSILTEKQEVRVHAQAQDASGGFHGIPGKETSFEDQLSQRQAVVRDGRYCFLPDKTPFALSITGEVSIRALQPMESSE